MKKTENHAVFAESLGKSLGGCLRDQTTLFACRECARAVGVALSPLPFVGTGGKRRFRALWSAMLHGLALRAAASEIPRLREDERLRKKFCASLERSAEEGLEAGLLSKLPEKDRFLFHRRKKAFLSLGLRESVEEEDFARMFLEALRTDFGIPGPASPAQVDAAVKQLSPALRLFGQLARMLTSGR